MRDEKPDGPDKVLCYRQAEPARRLVNLAQVPTLIVQSEASYHAGYDQCSVSFCDKQEFRSILSSWKMSESAATAT